jgi:hypothetical protein
VDANPAGPADSEQISYVNDGSTIRVCLTLAGGGVIGPQRCGSAGNQQAFAVKPAS